MKWGKRQWCENTVTNHTLPFFYQHEQYVKQDTELDESAARFVAKMQEAAFADIDSKLNRQAALAKVRMLENVKAQLNK